MVGNIESGPGGREPGAKPNFGSSDFHERLGVPKGASPEDISSAYRQAAKKTHPDVGGDVKDFKRVQEAFEGLNNPQRKSEHPGNNQRYSPEWAPMPPINMPKNMPENIPINMLEENRGSDNDPGGVIKLWKIIDEATVKLDKGEKLPNIDELRVLEKTIERYMNGGYNTTGLTKDFSINMGNDELMAASALDSIRDVINRHELIAAEEEFTHADQKSTKEKRGDPLELEKRLSGLYKARELLLKNNEWRNDGILKRAWHKLVYDAEIDPKTAERIEEIDKQINMTLTAGKEKRIADIEKERADAREAVERRARANAKTAQSLRQEVLSKDGIENSSLVHIQDQRDQYFKENEF